MILKYNEHKFVILNRLWVNKATFHKFKTCVAMNNLEFTKKAWILFAIDFILFSKIAQMFELLYNKRFI